MKAHHLFLILTIFCLESSAITLRDALLAAFKNNPEWLAKQTEKNKADEIYDRSLMAFLPSVQASFHTSRSKVNGEAYSRKYERATVSDGMELTIAQNLFNGFSTVNSMNASDNSAKAAAHRLKFEEQNLIIKIVDAFTSIWAGRQKVVALKKKEENLKKTLDSQESTMEAGVGTPSEVSSASANYHKAIYEKENAQTELFAAESEFEKFTGLKADQELELPDFNMELPKDLDNMIVQAMTSNHSILSSKFSELAALDELKAVKGRLSPSCDLTLRGGRNISRENDSRQEDSQKTLSNNYEASLRINVPIFDNSPSSGNTYSAIAIANQEALKAKFSAEDARQEIRKECVVNWNKYVTINAMINSSRSAVKSAELSSVSNMEESALGMKSNTDVLVKENQLLESRIDLANSLKQKIVTAVKLLVLVGNLDLNSFLKKKQYLPKTR
ncbi:MAG: TolC family protein [Holosporaceae bacterium]|jgi:TolC family type I secretion outer membrane protein|nr:TolC family protein [Holosporaceae bacterium]